MTDDTMVDHTMNTFQSGASCPKVSRGYDNITFPLFSKDMLIKGGAVFTGSVTRDFSGRGVGVSFSLPVSIQLTRLTLLLVEYYL
jgi:hypothetical protein